MLLDWAWGSGFMATTIARFDTFDFFLMKSSKRIWSIETESDTVVCFHAACTFVDATLMQRVQSVIQRRAHASVCPVDILNIFVCKYRCSCYDVIATLFIQRLSARMITGS